MRLRDHRTVHARRRNGKLRLAITGGLLALIIGVACLAPTALAPSALAPTVLAPVQEQPAGSAPGPVAAVAPLAPESPLISAAARATPTALPVPVPSVAPTPVIVPTLTPNGLTTLAGIKTDLAAQWVKNHTETPLRSGPSEDSAVFTRLPQWSLLEQIDSKPDWMMVQYGGDGATRQPGPGWVKASDVGAVDTPTVWLRSARAATVWSAADASAKQVVDAPPSTLLEVIGPDAIQATRVHVRLPGNGRNVPPSEGWVDGDAISRSAAPSFRDLPWAYPEDLRADVRINVPYRTQLDGSDYESANCGPTVLGMALESVGINLAPPELRGQVLESENFDPSNTDAGSYIWALARVAQQDGLSAQGLYEGDGALHHWTTDEIRASLLRGQPVIVQVVYRGLPGRQDSGYYGDHYIIITGLLGDKFLYNDPIGGVQANEAPGFDRVMTAAQLQRAMRASDSGYAFSAFALSRN